MRLVFTEQALNDLKRLREFIAINNPPAALLSSQKLVAKIRRLVDQSELGVVCERIKPVRELIADDYIVRYALQEDEIRILNIWHQKEER
jgi:addiction module RelE/StbE family toxin